ncbi:hypothetical protein F5B17DRAFT_311799 [Nemania serpens]|nr:hypothetical protein F5B17DRAFT_311799 [Nemania serpens]
MRYLIVHKCRRPEGCLDCASQVLLIHSCLLLQAVAERQYNCVLACPTALCLNILYLPHTNCDGFYYDFDLDRMQGCAMTMSGIQMLLLVTTANVYRLLFLLSPRILKSSYVHPCFRLVCILVIFD